MQWLFSTITTNPEYVPVLGSSVPKYWRKLSIKPKLLSPTKLNKMNFNKLYGFLSVKKFESGEEKSVGGGVD